MRTAPLPLLLLTGFLGSGKTSTLRHWLRETDIPLEKVAVIINDFGSVNVDATLLARRQLELRSITGGCVCCQSFDDLVRQTAALAANPAIELLWIETSGLADPEEVCDHLSSPELQDKTIIRHLILVVDGSDFPCSWRGRAVQEEQIRYSDLVLLNKTDLLEQYERQRVEVSIRQLNPAAQVVLSEHGRVDPALLSGNGLSSFASASGSHAHSHEHLHTHEDEPLPHAASTLFLAVPAPIPRADFQRFLGSLPSTVFRAKGFLRFAESPDQLHTFQQVRDQAELVVLPLESAPDITPGLVLIGPHLDEAHIRGLAAAALLSPA